MTAILGLGTVQFGLKYGIANSGVNLSDTDISDILALAHTNGITLLDTAARYGSSETRLGKHNLSSFRIVTKSIPALGRSRADTTQAIIDGAKTSISRLGVTRLDGFLIHDADDLLGPNGSEVYNALLELKASNLATKVGVSVYEEFQVDAIFTRFALDMVQLPINVIDQRFVRSGIIGELAATGVEVHARSVYLQGLLLMPLENTPPHFAHQDVIRRWHRMLAMSKMAGMEAALAYVRELPGVSAVLVGAVSAEQYRATIKAFSLRSSFAALDFASTDLDLIDPRRWPQ